MIAKRNYRITIETTIRPSASMLVGMLNILATENAEYYLGSWAVGNTPPTSLVDAGVIWQPDCPAFEVELMTAPLVFQRGIASCGPLAAQYAGLKQAEAIRSGLSFQAAAKWHRVTMRVEEGAPDDGAAHWHALYLGPGGVTFDVAAQLKRRNPVCP